jgi:hypothetical protein
MLKQSWRRTPLFTGKAPRHMEFLFKIMRMLHAVVGITPAEPDHERAYLLLWIGALALIIAVVVVFVVVFMPHIMR